jgi:seryl-tRNA synthetase
MEARVNGVPAALAPRGACPAHDEWGAIRSSRFLEFNMHDIRFIRENAEAFDRALKRRHLDEEEEEEFSSQNLLFLDGQRRTIIRDLESWQARRNLVSKAIGQAKAEKDEAKIQQLMAEVAECKASIANLETDQKKAEERLKKLLEQIPNLPLDDVPDGKDASDNVERHHFGAKREHAFTPRQHFELGEALGQMDFETAAKLSGARFVVLKKGLARLERALGQFMLDVHTREPHNYTEVAPPLLVRDEAMFGTAQLPKFEEDQFQVPSAGFEALMDRMTARVAQKLPDVQRHHKEAFGREMNTQEAIESLLDALRNKKSEYRALYEMETGDVARYWLIPTAEVPLTNLVRESIIDKAQLPMRFTACTPCFRAEAGAAGKDTRGMIRQHQFTKVELVSITTPEQSKDEHERMLSCAEEVLRRLGLHYRVMTLCAGDMGFASQKTYDIEVWLPGQGMYREISSCSVCGEFQARRMNARYRTTEGRQVRHVHTLNGSGVAVGRALIAVMETYQQEDGSIVVPEALAPYMGGIKKIERLQ